MADLNHRNTYEIAHGHSLHVENIRYVTAALMATNFHAFIGLFSPLFRACFIMSATRNYDISPESHTSEIKFQ